MDDTQLNEAAESYEARRNRAVERGRLEARAWLARLPVLARNLGPEWTAAPFVRRPDEDEEYDTNRASYLERTDGLRVHLPVPWERWQGLDGVAKRISITVAWPEKASGGWWSFRDVATQEERQTPPKGITGITLRPEATDIAITQAIRGRLLPACVPFFLRMVLLNAEHLIEANEAARVHRALCDRYGLTYAEPGTSRERRIWIRAEGVDHLVVAWDAKVDIHLDRLPLAQVVRVLDELLPVVWTAPVQEGA